MSGFYEWFALVYPKVIQFISEISNVIFTLLKVILNTLFLPIILTGVIIVEIPRVQAGIRIFDKNEEHNLLAAIVVVFCLLTFEFLEQYVLQQSGYKEERKIQFSLRIFSKRLRYFLGIKEKDKEFEILYKSPALRYRNVKYLITYGVIFLSVVGTLQEAIIKATNENKPWFQSLTDLLFYADLQTFFDAAVGLVFALIIVMASTSLSNYIGLVAYDAYLQMQNRQASVIQKRSERLTPEAFFGTFRSFKLKRLVYLSEDYFVAGNNKVAFFDSTTNKLSRSFQVDKERVKFIDYVTDVIGSRNA